MLKVTHSEKAGTCPQSNLSAFVIRLLSYVLPRMDEGEKGACPILTPTGHSLTPLGSSEVPGEGILRARFPLRTGHIVGSPYSPAFFPICCVK